MTEATIFLALVSSVGVARPVKVENTCLLKPPVKIVSGLPPLFQIFCSTDFSCASVKARWVPSVRVPAPSAAAGSAAPPALPLSVLVLIQDRIDAVLRGLVVPSPAALAWLVPKRIDSMSRLSSRPLSVSWYSSSSSRPACSTARWVPDTRATLSEIWHRLPSRTDGVAASEIAYTFDHQPNIMQVESL